MLAQTPLELRFCHNVTVVAVKDNSCRKSQVLRVTKPAKPMWPKLSTFQLSCQFYIMISKKTHLMSPLEVGSMRSVSHHAECSHLWPRTVLDVIALWYSYLRPGIDVLGMSGTQCEFLFQNSFLEKSVTVYTSKCIRPAEMLLFYTNQWNMSTESVACIARLHTQAPHNLVD